MDQLSASKKDPSLRWVGQDGPSVLWISPQVKGDRRRGLFRMVDVSGIEGTGESRSKDYGTGWWLVRASRTFKRQVTVSHTAINNLKPNMAVSEHFISSSPVGTEPNA